VAGVIDPDQPLPIYVQLKTLLLEEILSGVYGSDGQLPTEHQLCARYNISRTPVHRALAELAADGAILRQRRHGSFVNPHWIEHNRSRAELRVVVPEGPWADLVRAACPPEATLSVATVALDDLHQVLVRAVAEGRAPDVALLDSVWVPEFAASGFLVPLDDLDSDWLHADYLADVIDPFAAANVHDGRRYAVPAEADVAGLWYRRDVLDAAGLEPPRTWDRLLAACQALVDRGVRHPLAIPTGSRGAETTTYCLLALMATNGATALDGAGVRVDSPGTVECLRLLRDLVAIDALPADSVTYDRDRAARMLAHDQTAMAIGGSYELRTLARETDSTVDQAWRRFGFAPPPAGPRDGGSTLAGGMVHGIFRQAASPDLAIRLLRRLASTEALTAMSEQTGQLATRRSAVAEAARRSDFLQATAAMLDGAVVRPATRTYPRVSAQLQAMVEAVVVGRLEPEAAAHRTADLLAAVTGLPITRPHES
jgi:multiple sugar transport system substrate-binding protein